LSLPLFRSKFKLVGGDDAKEDDDFRGIFGEVPPLPPPVVEVPKLTLRRGIGFDKNDVVLGCFRGIDPSNPPPPPPPEELVMAVEEEAESGIELVRANFEDDGSVMERLRGIDVVESAAAAAAAAEDDFRGIAAVSDGTIGDDWEEELLEEDAEEDKDAL